MDSHDQDDLTELERRLGAWRPSTGALDRDRMLFDAGRASARVAIRERLWYATTAALILLAVGLGGLLVHERGAKHDLEVALAEATRKPSLISEPSPRLMKADPDSYLVLTHRALAGGLDDPSPDRNTPRVDAPLIVQPPPAPLRVRDLGGLMDL